MSVSSFFAIYIIFMIIVIIIEICLLSNDKSKYLNRSYKAIKFICDSWCKDDASNGKNISIELKRFYDEYVQEVPSFKKFYPNVVVWMDSVIYRITCGNEKTKDLKPYIKYLKEARDIMEGKNPFNRCEKYQQNILFDMKKLQNSENEIVMQNIINRTEEEFLRLSGEAKKNQKQNRMSMLLGFAGIIVSILMAFVKL